TINHVGYERGRLNHIGDINLILKKYPDFVYTLKKWRGELYYMTGTLPVIFEALQVWKEHPEAEYLFALHCDNIAFSKSFWKLSEKKRREISKWILQHKTNAGGYTLRQIQNIIKYKMTMDEFRDYENFKSECYTAAMGVPVYRYFKRKGYAGHSMWATYCDYRKMAKSAGHNIRQKYWAFPSDLEKAHAKVLRECIAIAEARKLAEKKRLAALEKNMFENLKKTCEVLQSFGGVYGGYEIIFTDNMQEWEKQAKALHQCIVRCSYYKKMANQEEILVFIQKDGIPVATAELFAKNRIGQFYADEHSGTPEGSKPSEEVQHVFTTWLRDKPDLLKHVKKHAKLAEMA
ncbi:MAG: PcfJ domain-containing protein, partial [Spirochaetaceae bacterium]|nr:PcfJ domain-containing protein [Spirochaetaceae bacterium]